MSGGRWDYKNDSFGREFFDWAAEIDYGLGTDPKLEEGRRIARIMNPLKDKQLSELLYDMLCLIHSADWYFSGDTGEDTYKADVKWFKDKWFKQDGKQISKMFVNICLDDLRDELYNTLGITEDKTDDSNS